jgi:hypothetical protein
MHRDIFNSNLPLSAPEAESEPSPDSEDEAEIADEA